MYAATQSPARLHIFCRMTGRPCSFIETRGSIISNQSNVNQDQFVHNGLHVKVCSEYLKVKQSWAINPGDNCFADDISRLYVILNWWFWFPIIPIFPNWTKCYLTSISIIAVSSEWPASVGHTVCKCSSGLTVTLMVVSTVLIICSFSDIVLDCAVLISLYTLVNL